MLDLGWGEGALLARVAVEDGPLAVFERRDWFVGVHHEPHPAFCHTHLIAPGSSVALRFLGYNRIIAEERHGSGAKRILGESQFGYDAVLSICGTPRLGC